MLKIENTDIQSLADFPLSWRWTDPKWNQLPEAALQRISPLSGEKAKELWRIEGHFVLSDGPRVNLFECSPWIDASVDTADAFEKVRDWLLGRFSDREQQVIVSWDKDTAVVVAGVCSVITGMISATQLLMMCRCFPSNLIGSCFINIEKDSCSVRSAGA